MMLSEDTLLSSLTTFKLGGAARGYVSCKDLEEVKTALALSRERGLPWYVIGGGSNLLASDSGYDGMLIHLEGKDISFEEAEGGTNDTVLVIAEAGVVWNDLVEESVSRGLWGIENLAGIPGSVGGAPVQNIGAYGADVSQTLAWVEAFDTATETVRHFTSNECEFGYRESRFKHDSSLIILRVAFNLKRDGIPHIGYADLKAKADAGVPLDTSSAIACAVREIRAGKFPDLTISGTAGSFFKNPTISPDAFTLLHEKYPELPGFEADGGIKISLAWILDHALKLRGYSQGSVRLFEKQPLVIVAEKGATEHDVDALARDVESRVLEATGITLEREVRML